MIDRQQKERAEELYAIACFYTEYGFHANALDSLFIAICLDPENNDVFGKLFWYYENRNKMPGIVFTEAKIQILADSAHVKLEIAKDVIQVPYKHCLFIAQLYAFAHDYKMAYYYFEKAKTKEPQNPFPYEKMALIDALFMQYDKAILLLEKAISLNPVCASAYKMKGEIERLDSKNVSAKESLEMFLALVPKDDPACAKEIQNAKNMLEEINEIATKTA